MLCRIGSLFSLFVSFTGQASSANAEIVGLYAKEIANTAWKVASNSNLKPTNQKGGSVPPGGKDPGRKQYSTSATSSMSSELTGNAM